jgi:hypothetical protein
MCASVWKYYLESEYCGNISASSSILLPCNMWICACVPGVNIKGHWVIYLNGKKATLMSKVEYLL